MLLRKSASAIVLCALFASVQAVAQAPTGTITGVVLDSQTGRPVPGASLSLDGTLTGTVTDAEGHFTVRAEPGTHVIRFTSLNYHPVDLTDVVVVAGKETEASTVMSSTSVATSIDVVESATAVGATAQAMLIEQKLAPVISDSLSRQELSAGTSSDAAGALEKVTGVSVVGDGFVYVRGLGERYSAAQMNGAMMATTEPEKRVVPLDLFPATLIENMRIMKTYSPDLPAEFSGGLVQMQTIDFPAQKIFNVSIKSGFNSRTSFQPFLTYPGGGRDYFGFDDGTRALPAAIPTDQRLFPGRFTPAELQAFGRSFSTNWEPTTTDSVRPQFDWSAVSGGTFGRLGVIGAVTFGNKPTSRSELQRYFRQGSNAPLLWSEYEDFRDYSEQAKLGGVLNAAIQVNQNNQLIFRNTLTHDTEKSAREFSGYDGGSDQEVQTQRLRWIERLVFSTAVEGNHSFPNWGNSLIHWQLTHSRSTRDEPDLREVIRGKQPDGSYVFVALGSSGIRFFSELDDTILEPQIDYSIPFFRGSVSGLFKTGFRVTMRDRDFEARRFRFIPQQTPISTLLLPSNRMFAPENIGPTGFQLTEFTRGTDTYSAEMNVVAGYTMLDLALGPRWRFTGGIRFEGSRQEVTTIDNLVPNQQPVIATLENTDPVPAVNVIYALNGNQNLRVSYSRTLSRPDFRELSPFDFNDVLGGFVTQGNADLKRATINNYDLRWERFSSGNQLIAASVFAKTFTDPIETTIIPSNDLRQTYVNADSARNLGFELEFRRALGSFVPKLNDWSVSTNFTFVDSNVDIKQSDAALLTSPSHPLLGQSRYIANVTTEWSKPRWRSNARLFVNYVSRRLSDLNTFGLADLYQEANTILDFAYQLSLSESGNWGVKFEAENLTDNEYLWTIGDEVQRRYRSGRSFQIGTSYSFF
jgi:TonB-dependent receptor